MLIDSHCHLNMLDLSQQPEGLLGVLQNAKTLGVEYFLNIATEPSNWQEVLDIAKAHDNIFASVGLHPSDACEKEPSIEEIVAWGRDNKIVAIGETGLDYFHIDISIELQQERFRRHIQAARMLQKPLIIHTRHAREDTLRILKEEKADEIGGVLHCFTESVEMAKAAMDLNFYVSFSGIVTFKNANELREVALIVPSERLLIETDAPFLTPVPYRGKPNQPGYVYYVAKFLSEWRNESFDRLAEQTSKNFFDLFKCDL